MHCFDATSLPLFLVFFFLFPVVSCHLFILSSGIPPAQKINSTNSRISWLQRMKIKSGGNTSANCQWHSCVPSFVGCYVGPSAVVVINFYRTLFIL